ncbi:penicillin-binding protein activator [Vibrio metschnikovii]|uniref:Penicillin-binding protein activator n=1 Tax=bacterium 19PA01SH03 TaxID=2920705 RepID=A0AAU6SRC7_UNCXX|nr:penicillin-binding protein activator [Vibrio metschnikovii]EKO3596031.1 penicillin-binding protein activator [Vibrio metschnikovii]EKO3620679.1 penicillin-binding protein activator [Vibrio metschnikovii]EKO3623893.1 penicillin-binding protein activator [Vibrio metschnikovii]EKO3630946.1 penicillin-binding protein activator [Vibrio metschnikovii]
MKNHQRCSVTRLLTPVALAIMLAACSTTPSVPTSVQITDKPQLSAQIYLMRADSSQGNLQNDWLIMALKAAVAENDRPQAELLIRRLSKQTLSDAQQAEWQLARAQLSFNQQQYQAVLSRLSFPTDWRLDPRQWQKYYQLRADSLLELDRAFDANRELVGLYEHSTSQQQSIIAQQIWQNFDEYSSSTITTLTTASDEEILDGWLQLAIYVKTLGSDLPQLKNTLEQWLKENASHPAARYTPQTISDILALDLVKPTHTALLLPLSGRFAKQAELIRDGFIMAMMNDPQRDPNATLTILDTNTESLESVDATLAEKQVDFVVGPLVKSDIEKLQTFQKKRGQAIPTLALNIPDKIEPSSTTCYLTLSPEQEVAQAAKYLFSQGYRYPLILAPQGSYGDRVVEAFNQEWRQYSTNKVAVNLFGDKRQLQRNINNVFGLQASQQNIAQMNSLLGISLESQPRSRRDIDAVYITAGIADLTLIKPFIEVAINPDTRPPKLFSNSNSNSGGRQFEDLSGITYSDIPLLIEPNNPIATQAAELWPRTSNADRRLQALGMDAYQLMLELPQMKAVKGYTISGQTGVLGIDQNCIVQREISWAEHGAL